MGTMRNFCVSCYIILCMYIMINAKGLANAQIYIYIYYVYVFMYLNENITFTTNKLYVE